MQVLINFYTPFLQRTWRGNPLLPPACHAPPFFLPHHVRIVAVPLHFLFSLLELESSSVRELRAARNLSRGCAQLLRLSRNLGQRSAAALRPIHFPEGRMRHSEHNNKKAKFPPKFVGRNTHANVLFEIYNLSAKSLKKI